MASRASFIARLCVALSAIALAGSCDSAFHGRGISHHSQIALTFQFSDGTATQSDVQGDSIEVVVDVPRVGYDRMLDPKTLTIDPTRLSLTADRALGDPSNGGFDPNNNLSAFAIAQGWVTVLDPGGSTREIHVAMNSATPLLFPTGLLHFTLRVTDDVDHVSDPFVVELTLLSPERPTLVVRLETPPPGSTPTGQLLPFGADGQPFVGASLPFALITLGIPNPTTGAGFTRLFGAGGLDPTRFVVTADQDLGDPTHGGIAAGTNLAPLFATSISFVLDPVTGQFTTGMLFPLDAAFSPVLGTTTFTGIVLDDDDVACDPQAAPIESVARVTLAGQVQPIFDANCAFFGCHGTFPVLGLDLSDGQSWANTVNVRASETPATSCATLRIAPYDSLASYLFHKLDGTHLGGCVEGSGEQMPLGGPYLSSSDLALVEQWILQGAADD